MTVTNVTNFMYEFAEETTTPAGQDQNSSDGTKNTDTKDGQDKNTAEHMIPKSRFDEVNQKFKDLQAKLDTNSPTKKPRLTQRGKRPKKKPRKNRASTTNCIKQPATN